MIKFKRHSREASQEDHSVKFIIARKQKTNIRDTKGKIKDTDLTSSKGSGKTFLPGLIGGLSLFEEGLRNLDLLSYNMVSGTMIAAAQA